MHWAVRFWLLFSSVAAGIGSLAFLSLSFVFPDAALFDVGAAGRLAATILGVTAFSVIVWSGISDQGMVSANDPGNRR
jgi:hypothetical protein